MKIELDIKRIKNRLFKSLKINTYKDLNELKKKIDTSPVLIRYILPQIIFELSKYDYNFSFFEKSFFEKLLIKSNNILRRLSYIFKISFNLFRNNKFYHNPKIIILSRHKYIDQLNFFPLSNQMKKKHLVIFGLNEAPSNAQKEYKNKSIDLNQYINFFDFIRGSIEYYKNKRYLNNLPINFNNEEFKNKFYKKFFFELVFYKRILRNFKPKIILSSTFFGNEALVYYFKEFKKMKTKFYDIGFNGIGGDSGFYLHHFSNLVLVPSKNDSEIMNELKKNSIDIIKVPKVKIIGNIRQQYWEKNLKIKLNKNKRIKIFFISSNPIYFSKNIEKEALKIFIKFSLNYSQFDYLIKERPSFKNDYYKSLIKNKNIKIFNDKNLLIEDLINESDICVGTSSTALLRQAAFQNKFIIQMFHKYCYMSKIKNQSNVDTYRKFKNEIFQIINKKKKKNDQITNLKLNPIKEIEKLIDNL